MIRRIAESATADAEAAIDPLLSATLLPIPETTARPAATFGVGLVESKSEMSPGATNDCRRKIESAVAGVVARSYTRMSFPDDTDVSFSRISFALAAKIPLLRSDWNQRVDRSSCDIRRSRLVCD